MSANDDGGPPRDAEGDGRNQPRGPVVKLRGLEMALQKLSLPEEPRAELEQYQTPAPMAARLLWVALGNGDITGRRVLDPGCGNGILGIGAAMLGASEVLGFDSDRRMAELSARNAARHVPRFRAQGGGSQAARPATGFLCQDISDFARDARDHSLRFDTTVMNPPFGAQSKGADRPFLALAFSVSDAVYSVHRKGTEEFVGKAAAASGFEVRWEETDAFDVPRMFDFHTKELERVGVTLYHMVRSGR